MAADLYPSAAVLSGHAFERIAIRTFTDAPGDTTATRLTGAGPASLKVPSTIPAAMHEFDDISNITPQHGDEVHLWQPVSKTHAATDFIITRGREVYFMQCTVSKTHKIIARTVKSKKEGLLGNADTLADAGFNTRGAVIFVHVVKEWSVKSYEKGKITPLTEAAFNAAMDAPAKGRKPSKPAFFLSEADVSRIQQYVCGVDVSALLRVEDLAESELGVDEQGDEGEENDS